MNAKERVEAALRFEETDVVPWDFEFVDGLLEPLQALYGVDDVYRHIGNHIFRFAVGGYARTPSEAVVVDDFGISWLRDKAQQRIGGWGGIVSHPLAAAPDLRGYQFPDPHRPEVFADVPRLVAEHADQFIIAEIPQLFEVGWEMRGFEAFLMDLYDSRPFVEELFDRITDYGIGLLDEFATYPIDGIWCGDDWSHQTGLFMPPVVWRSLFKPRLRRLYGAIRAKGLAVVTHCCGDCTELIPDLIEIGASMLNPMQPEAMDVEWVNREYGRDIAFYGGMGVQGVIVTGTPDDVRRIARERIARLGRGGGFVFGSGSSITADTPIENAIACVEVAMNQSG